MKPFIIWTVQRTGGTNFATNIIRASGLPITQHEPLNVGRSFGYITENWVSSRDHDKLQNDIGLFLDKGYPIKHCVENVDWEINESLAIQSARRGFWNIILYRENSIDRLASLKFALSTGLWGRKKVSLAKEMIVESLGKGLCIKNDEINHLISHENRCNERLIRVARLTDTFKSKTYALSFEDIYHSEESEARRKVSLILDELNLSNESFVSNFINQLRSVGDQGSKILYKEIAGYAELEEGLKKNSPLRGMLETEFPKIIL